MSLAPQLVLHTLLQWYCTPSHGIADLDLVLPEKTVFVPPTVLLQLAATVVLGLVALVGALTQVRAQSGQLAVSLECKLRAPMASG